MNDAVRDLLEPVGADPAVQEAVDVLWRAMGEASQRQGHQMRTFAVVWCTEHKGDGYGASFIRGNEASDVMEFLAAILLDDSQYIDMPEMGRRVN